MSVFRYAWSIYFLVILTNLTFVSTAVSAEPKLPTVISPKDSTAKQILTDASFVEKATASHLEDSELSNLALKKSKNEKLKKFAQRIIGQNPPILKELKRIAAAHKLEVPQKLNGEQRQMVDQMQTLKNEEFDRAYVDVIKKSQDTIVGLYDNAAGQTSLNSDTRSFVAQQLPKLRKNQELVHALMQTAPPPAEASKP
jgi:putative membrane protein